MKKQPITQKTLLILLVWLLGVGRATAQCPGSIADANLAEAIRTLYPDLINTDNSLTAAAATQTKLDLSGWGNAKYANDAASPDLIKTKPKLTTLVGIECFTALTVLEVSNQRIAALPGTLPATLEFLSLQSNSLTALPTLPAGLKYLRVGDNRLTALPELPAALIYLIANKQSSSAPNATGQLTEGVKRLASLPTLPSGLKVLDINDNKLTILPELPTALAWMNIRNNQAISCLPTLPASMFTTSLNTGPLSSTSLNGLTPPGDAQRLNISSTAITCMPNLPTGANPTRIYYCGGCGVNMASVGALCSQTATVQSVVGACSLPGLITGAVKVNATIPAGVLTLEYSKDNGATFQTSNQFTGLAPGTYTILTRRKSGMSCPTPATSGTASVTTCEPQQYYANSETGEDAPDRGAVDRPWKTISYALKQIGADQGHTLNLSAHLFEESAILTIPSGINIIGQGWNKTIVKINAYYRMLDFPLADKCFGNAPGFENYNPASNKFVIQMNGNNQRLANFFLDGQDKKCHGGIHLKEGSNVVFDSLKVTKFFYAGIWMGKGQNLEVKHCLMQDNAWGNNTGSYANLMFWNVQKVSIHDNIIEELTPITYRSGGTPLGGYTIKASDPTRQTLCRDFTLYKNVMDGVKIYNNTLKVLPYGVWQNGTAPSITIEFVGTSYKNCEIYGNYINNHISMVSNRDITPGYAETDKTVRVHHNYFDLGNTYSYAIELNTPMSEVDSNFFKGGYYPISCYEDRTVNWHDQNIHHNVFYLTKEGFFPFNYNRYPKNFRLNNNTFVAATRLKTLFNFKGSGGANPVYSPAAEAEMKNNIFISLVGSQGDLFDETAFVNPSISNNLFYNINSFGENRIVVDSTKAPNTILKLVGEMLRNNSLYRANPQPFFELAEGSPAANAGVVVPGTTDGYKASAPDLGAYESDLTTVTPTVFLKVTHQDGDGGQVTNNHIKPNLQLRNEGQATVPYSELTARYWFTTENFAPINTWVDYAQVGNSKVKLTYVRLTQPRTGADGYIEYAFDPSSGTLPTGGNSGPIQSRFSKQTWTDFNEADDYSFGSASNYTENGRITLYRNGALLWGDEPALTKSTLQLAVQSENKNPDPATNTISTYLNIRNNGNTPVAYKDLRVRYWFTAEGTQPLNYWVDYAQLGNNKVGGSFVKPADPLNGADTYFEISIDSTLGSLQPLSNTGNIHYRLAKTDWSAFNETNDHSYTAAAPMADNERITLYHKGKLVYGTEPELGGSAGGRRAAVSVETPGFGLYPNPASAQVIIRSGSSNEPIDVTLTGLNGRVLHQEKTRFNTPIEVDQLMPGLYLLKVQTATQVKYLKLLKQ